MRFGAQGADGAASLLAASLGVFAVWVEQINDWSDWLVIGGKANLTIKQYRKKLTQCAEYFGEKGESPWDVTSEELIAWMGPQPWSKATRMTFNVALRSFYKWAVKAGRTMHNPADILPSISAPIYLPKPCPQHVFDRAIAHANYRERLALVICRYAGLRRFECAKLHENDVLDGRLLIHGKGDKDRIVPTHPLLNQELQEALDRKSRGVGSMAEYRFWAHFDEGWLFPGRYGAMSPISMGRMIARVLGENEWTAHNLRHAVATQLYDETGDIFLVQQFLGHERVETTKIYTQVSQRRLDAAIANLSYSELPCSTNGGRAGVDWRGLSASA